MTSTYQLLEKNTNATEALTRVAQWRGITTDDVVALLARFDANGCSLLVDPAAFFPDLAADDDIMAQWSTRHSHAEREGRSFNEPMPEWDSRPNYTPEAIAALGAFPLAHIIDAVCAGVTEGQCICGHALRASVEAIRARWDSEDAEKEQRKAEQRRQRKTEQRREQRARKAAGVTKVKTYGDELAAREQAYRTRKAELDAMDFRTLVISGGKAHASLSKAAHAVQEARRNVEAHGADAPFVARGKRSQVREDDADEQTGMSVEDIVKAAEDGTAGDT